MSAVSNRLAGKIAEAKAILDEACELHDPAALFGMFSGGHDSLCASHIASRHPRFTALAHVNTTIGIEETRQFVRDTAASWAVILKEYRPPVSYREIVLQHGFPGPGGHAVIYARLKERAIRQMVREHKRKWKDRIALVTGVRLSESQRRMGHVERIQREGAKLWVAPILNWDDADKHEYISFHGLARNAVVDQLCMSGECLCGAFAHRGELAEITALYPETARVIRALEAEVLAAGKHAVWGERPPGRSARASKSGGALCHSCAVKHPDLFDSVETAA